MTQNRFINRRKINARIPKKLTILPGQLGDGAGQVVTGIANYVYCRVNGQVQIVFNSRVPPDNDLLVDVGYAYDSPGQYQVLGTRSAAPGGAGSSMQLGYPKAARYQLFAQGGGQDPLWLDKRQILDLLVWPNGGLTVRVYPGIVPLGTSYGYIPLTIIDLTSHLPADEGEAALVLLTVDGDGDIVETKGTEFTLADVTGSDDMLSHIPAYPAGTAYVMSAVRVYNGQDAIVVSRTVTDIIPLGFAVVEGGGAGDGDMLKSVYDTDNDGVVDSADEVDGVATAGNSKYYGTNVSGTPGFHSLSSLPSGSVSTGIDSVTIPGLLASADRIGVGGAGFSDEWNDTTPGIVWTPSTPSIVDSHITAPSHLYVESTDTTERLGYRAYAPAGNFDVRCKISLGGNGAGSSGLVVASANNQQRVALLIFADAVTLSGFGSSRIFVAVPYTYNNSYSVQTGRYAFAGHVYLRITRGASNAISYFASSDGIIWSMIRTVSFSFTPAQVGFRSADAPHAFAVDWLRGS